MAAHFRHYLTAPPSRLHLDLAADLRDLHRARGRRENRIAPRGAGKTVWSTTGYVTYAAMAGVERYTLVLSQTADQANGFLRDVRAEVEANPSLAAAYPHAAGRGPIWRDNLLKLRNGAMIQARGVGGSIRGLKNRSARPTLVVVDDPNEDEDAYSPTKRRRKLDWFLRAVMNVGGPDTNVVVLGTAIHRQAVVYELYRGETAAAWNTKAYRSVLSWPDRMDLWGEWEGLLRDLSDPAREATARAFYDARAAEMGAGAEVLWPEREPLYQLMLHRVAIGRAAFDSDKQDRPGADGATEFPAEWFDWPDRWFSRWPDDLAVRAYALDPSKGAGDRAGDYQAHVWGGLSRDGVIYVDADARREPVTDMVARAVDGYLAFGAGYLDAEGNNTMGLLWPEFARRLDARRAAGKPHLVNYLEHTSTDPKLRRIREGGRYLGTRHPEKGATFRVRNSPGGRMLADQLRDVPNGEWDDLPDALGTLVRRLETWAAGRR